MRDNARNLLLIEFDPSSLPISELQALHHILLESVKISPQLAKWLANEFLRPELERRQAEDDAPAKRYYPFPSDWSDADIGQALLLATGLITGGDFAPTAKDFLAQVAQQVTGIAASRLLERR